jgi:hypothetical protein
LVQYLSMNTYDITVPTFVKRLDMLKKILAKAEAHAKEAGISEEAILNDRLTPDMFPLKKQIQLASDHTKRLVSSLTDKENPKMPDIEETFAQLQERIDKTLEFVHSVTADDFAGADEKKIEMKKYPGKYLTGAEYALEYSLPQFYFHVTTAYALLRKNGVPLGKVDFLNGYSLKDL